MEIFCFGWEGAGLPALTSRGTVAERVGNRRGSGTVAGSVEDQPGDSSGTRPDPSGRVGHASGRGPVGDPSRTAKHSRTALRGIWNRDAFLTGPPTGPRRIPDGSRRVPTGLDGWSGRAGGRATRGGMRGQERGGGWGRANFPVGISEI